MGYLFSNRTICCKENKLAMKWTDRDIMDVYSKVFKSTINLFEKLVVNKQVNLKRYFLVG